MHSTQHQRLHQLFLVLGAFFNPFGFDALWALVQHWTGSYWLTSFSFYLASATCFGLAWWLQRRARTRDQIDV